MSHYKLTYFNVRARAEILKLIFAAAGVEFEDNRLEGPQWPGLKPTTPFGSMPLLEVDGVTLAQTKAIGRFLAHRFGLAGETDVERAIADSVVDYHDDIATAAQGFKNEKDEAKKAEGKKKFLDEQLPVFLERLETILKKNPTGSGYFAGKNLTWADLGLIILFGRLGINEGDNVLVKYEKLRALHKRLLEHPKIATWIANNSKTPIFAGFLLI